MRPDPARRDPLVARLRASGSVFAEDEADVLLEAADDAAHLERLTRRRETGEPLEVVVGRAEVAGTAVAVRAGVFVPRRRSVVLVDEAVRLLAGRRGVLVDLCCGTGALGLAVARRVPGTTLVATDVDEVACACAAENLAGVGTVHRGDLLDALPDDLRGRVDVLLVNAPYVPTDAIATMPPEARLHEPVVALDGGVDGVAVHRRLAAGAGAWLARGGAVVVETSRAQLPLTRAAFGSSWRTSAVRDEEHDGTAVRATRR